MGAEIRQDSQEQKEEWGKLAAIVEDGMEGAGGDSRGGQVSHCPGTGEGDTATRPPTAFCPAIIWQEC